MLAKLNRVMPGNVQFVGSDFESDGTPDDIYNFGQKCGFQSYRDMQKIIDQGLASKCSIFPN